MPEWDERKLQKIAEIDKLDAELQRVWHLNEQLFDAIRKKGVEVRMKLTKVAANSSPVPQSAAQLLQEASAKSNRLAPELERTFAQVRKESESLIKAQDKFAAISSAYTQSAEAVAALPDSLLDELAKSLNEHIATIGRVNALCQTELLELDTMNDELDRLLDKLRPPS